MSVPSTRLAAQATHRTLTRESARTLRWIPSFIVYAIIATATICAAFGSLISPMSPEQQDLLLGATPPSAEHLLGTDDLGRDVLSRLIVGARSAIIGPIAIAIGALLLGSTIGLIAGFRGGRIGGLLMRTVDLIYALPAFLVAIVLAGVIGGGYWFAVGLLVVLFCPFDARIVRGATLQQRRMPYVQATRLLGMSQSAVLLKEIWPNVRPLELANAFLNFAFGLVYLASLAFLGIGVPPGVPDWGRMVSEGLGYIELNPWGVLAPGLAIVLVAASVTLLGDRLEERLADSGRTL